MTNDYLTRTPLFVIAGPCVIESLDQSLQIATHMKGICDKLGIAYVFKASFDKANRSSNGSFRGPGLEDGLIVLKAVKEQVGVPVLTDVHESYQVAEAASVVDILQIPAFLARQTDLLHAAGRSGAAVNIKKGQFMSPQEMSNAVEKVKAARGDEASAAIANRRSVIPSQTMLTERGSFFGYNRLVNDFTGLAIMKSFGVPVIFDVTHSTQQPAALGGASGGNPQYAPLLARAAVATGCVDGLFLEVHPDPKNAKSDAATVLSLETVEHLLEKCCDIAAVIREPSGE
ncbi:MAG TPA: 3-deoxy-8-phosphooctulonate synthase [Tepidisphaeraceae bacterium]|jgi:2-dehydro-3-deoxyphosphooctonate aldolase (KDO 8-P synthase)|nr:3-deoxy-8-phosphooctulonate synthase [Tepidisphaeraceae bacterium]